MISSKATETTRIPTYYILAKFTSPLIIPKQDVEHFAKQMLTKLGTDIHIQMMEIGELID
jgi:hypothetical protein